MAIVPAVRARAHPPAVRARPASRHRWLSWLLAGGWIAQVAIRLWLFRYHAGPVANPDETGYLIAARWLAGGPGADFSGSTLYQGGYALLLVPVYWVTSDPAVVYRLVVAVGSMAAAGAFPLAYLLLRRLEMGRRAALAVAFAAGLAPALLLFSGLALVDAILPTLVLGWLLAVHDLAGKGSAWAGAAGAGLSAFAMAVHLRGMVILAVFVLLVAVLLVAKRLPRRAGLAALAVAGAVALAGMSLNGALSAELYPGGPRDLAGLLISRLTSLDGQAWAVSGAIGQLWYLIAGTWGLAGVGLASAAVAVARRSTPHGHRIVAATLLLTTLGIAYASSAALPDEHRVGNYVYGRYLACVAVAWILAGVIALARARRVTVLRHGLTAATLLAATGGLAAWYAADRLRTYAFIAFDFPEASYLSGVRDALDMTATSTAALILLACLTAVSLLPRRHRLPALAAVLAAINIAFAADLAPKSAPAPGKDWLPYPPPGRVAVDRQVKWHVRVPLTYRVWWTRLEMYDSTPPSGACTAIVPAEAGPPPTPWIPTGEGGVRMGWVSWSNPSCRS